MEQKQISVPVGPKGFIYFIRAGRTSSIKIGWALDPLKRQEGLQKDAA